MHLVIKNDEEVKTAIDQCVATVYMSALILSFESHNQQWINNTTALNIAP